MMKITVIHGQSHEGNTCMVARELANKVGGEIREFFLPMEPDYGYWEKKGWHEGCRPWN